MRIATWQAPLELTRSSGVIEALATQVRRCENAEVSVVCFPEAVIGDLADYRAPHERVTFRRFELPGALAQLASPTVTSIVGFTEAGDNGLLFNAAAILQDGGIAGVYRKNHPAINHSVYAAGTEAPLFHASGFVFGVVICLDSTFQEPATSLVMRGAQVLFIPTNNGLPAHRFGPEVKASALAGDVERATASGVYIVRADVVGHCGDRTSHGATHVIAPGGHLLGAARGSSEDLLIVDVRP